MAFAALSLSVNAQEGPRIWQGGPGKKYIDRATLDRRAKNYHFVINDQSSDVYLAKYKGKKCWFGGATGRDNLLKGAVGQTVQNMNIMFGIDETTGLRLKPSAF